MILIPNNCYKCGCRITEMEDATVQEVFGVGHVVCKDRDECQYNMDDMGIPEDTDCLEEPWWAYR